MPPVELPPNAPVQPTPASSTSPPRVDSARLFGGATEVQIDHRGVIYRLKQTSLGKLILTK